jgi:hypothetical protein
MQASRNASLLPEGLVPSAGKRLGPAWRLFLPAGKQVMYFLSRLQKVHANQFDLIPDGYAHNCLQKVFRAIFLFFCPRLLRGRL